MRYVRVALRVCMGVALVTVGFFDYHVDVAAIVVGLVLLGVIDGDRLAVLVRRAIHHDPSDE